MDRRIAGVLALAFSVSSLTVSRVRADEADPTSDLPGVGSRIPMFVFDEVTVIARKREENLQDTPLSVSALTTVQLRDATVTRIDDVGRMIPNFQFDSDDTGANARMQIRGAGTSDWLVTRDPAVGIYVDGVYLPRAQGALLDLGDFERVEVLRGPQGTLYGRNSIGGAVNLISRKPSSRRFADFALRLGDFRLVETKSSLDLPILPDLLMTRLSFTSRTRKGYTDNEANGDHTDNDRLLAGRGSVRLVPREGLELLVSGDFSREHKTGRGGQCRYSSDAPAATGVVTDPAGVGAPQPILTLVPFMDFATGFVSRCRSSKEVGDLEYVSDVSSEIEMDTQGLGNTVTWDLSDGVTLKSISSWRRVEIGRDQEFDFTESAFGRLDGAGDQMDAWSQEFTLSGSAFNARLDWTAGTYAFWEKANPGKELTLIATGLGTLGFSYAAVNKTENQNFAGYGQATWHATERVSLTAGIRRLVERKGWNHRRHSLVGSLTDPGVGPVQANPGPDGLPGTSDDVPLDFDTAERFDAWTGLMNLAYQPSDDLLVYAQWANGYKSGGFNGRTNPADLSTLDHYEPEKLDSYEVGLKSSWLDRSLLVNVALFHSDYDDIQQTVFKSASDGSFSSVVRNAGEAAVRGAELEVQSQPLPRLTLSAALGITDAKYEENVRQSRYVGPGPNGIFGDADDAPRLLNRKDEDFLNTPAYTLSLASSYRLQTPWGELKPSVSWYVQSEVNYAPAEDIQGSSFGVQDKYGLLDARVSLRLRDGRTEVALWGRNLLDRRYKNSALDFTDGFAVTDVYFGAPRMLGIEVRVATDL